MKTGIQQYAFLYGNYVKDEKIPLGICALVSAIYTPSKWTPSQEEEVKQVDEFAKKLGLLRIGWIWSQLGNEKSSGRDGTQVRFLWCFISNIQPLKVNEMYHIAKQQHLHPNIWKDSNTGKWGSKFVSVIVYGKTWCDL